MNNTDKIVDLKNFNQEQLVAYVESLGQPSFRGRQIFAWLYKPGVHDFSQMTDLAKDFRAILAQHAVFSSFHDPITEISRDGTVKFGFHLNDGKIIETVLIPEEDRNTLCVSSQVGCAMGCRFCLTGDMGFARNLSPAEIVNQVCGARDWILANGRGRLTNLVFMGMGEPLANLDNLLIALSILTNQRGLDFSSRRITVSTCGLPEKMIELGSQTDVNLAVSLHATDDETRSMLMPVNRKYPIKDLLAACKTFPMKKRQRIMFEYTLFSGINDSDAHARKLAEILRGIPCKINLLAMNVTPGSNFTSPSHDRILEFQQILRRRGYTVFIRQSRGGDISAACGQLAGKARNSEEGSRV
ncbi:MAG: 23S rRNA (adenine(2503)-C(2))-methyltransferase RlmN [Desulfobulbaceae bacterium]|nr:23S rRNA (adenine(2503)-C(2))-methyltransferase RlmN [Desulfobulbaceae bacterium]